MFDNHYLDQYFAVLADYLVALGISAEQAPFAAFVTTYFGLTLLVLLLVVLLLRRRSRHAGGKPRKQPLSPDPPALDETSDVQSEDPVASSDVLAEPTADSAAAHIVRPDEFEPQEALQEPVALRPGPSVAVPHVSPEVEQDASLFQRLRQGLAKTRGSLLGRVDALWVGRSSFDDDFIEDLEEILITADFGMQATQDLLQSLSKRMHSGPAIDAQGLRQLLRAEIQSRLLSAPGDWAVSEQGPLVIMVVGVNGVGKTTTIGKLARQFADQGRKVVLGAGDTFRAAAAQQLQVWGERSGAEVICQTEGSDPAAVAFDAARAAMARKADVLILDTAGRLHTKLNLMEELKKIRRVLGREIPGAPHETLLVLDATTGQNALTQAKMFKEAVEVTGIALTKLDGTAKGGIVVAIGTQLGLPVRLIGVGEGVADLRLFKAEEFVAALFSDTDPRL